MSNFCPRRRGSHGAASWRHNRKRRASLCGGAVMSGKWANLWEKTRVLSLPKSSLGMRMEPSTGRPVRWPPGSVSKLRDRHSIITGPWRSGHLAIGRYRALRRPWAEAPIRVRDPCIPRRRRQGIGGGNPTAVATPPPHKCLSVGSAGPGFSPPSSAIVSSRPYPPGKGERCNSPNGADQQHFFLANQMSNLEDLVRRWGEQCCS
jgi:hypothetical protein